MPCREDLAHTQPFVTQTIVITIVGVAFSVPITPRGIVLHSPFGGGVDNALFLFTNIKKVRSEFTWNLNARISVGKLSNHSTSIHPRNICQMCPMCWGVYETLGIRQRPEQSPCCHRASSLLGESDNSQNNRYIRKC